MAIPAGSEAEGAHGRGDGAATGQDPARPAGPGLTPPGGAADDEASVRPLLARAHLLRMRGQWDEAVTACTEALRRVPNSATACSLLGDVYEAQDKLDVALHWYGMAVEFAPDNTYDRERYGRLLSSQRSAAAVAAASNAAAAGNAPEADVANRTLQWFDRIFPPGKYESIAKLLLIVGGGLFLLLAGIAAAFVGWGSGGGEDPVPGMLSAPPVQTNSPQLVPAAPVQPAPRSAQVAPAAGAAATPRAAAPLAQSSPRPAAADADETVSPEDEALRDLLARAMSDGVRLLRVRTSPDGTGSTTLSIALRLSSAPQAQAAARERVLRAAMESLRAAAREMPQTERLAVRVFVDAPEDADQSRPAFSGETAGTAVRALDPVRASPAEIEGLFTEAAWSLPVLEGPASRP